jgi:uncharacterized damage-inducible protein DinB
MEKGDTKQLREQLVKHIEGGEAFRPLDELLEEIPYEQLGMRPQGMPYSFFELFYHIRLAQHDILEFSRSPDYGSPPWPEGYWPKEQAPQNPAAWEELKRAYFDERQQFCELLLDPTTDLFAPISHGSGQSLLREALLVVEHTAYHTGQLLAVLRLLGLH